MKYLHAKSTQHLNEKAHSLSLATALRHPELETNSTAQTDIDLFDNNDLAIPQGAVCKLTGRTTYFAYVVLDGVEESDTYQVPMYVLHAYQLQSVQ